RNWLEPLALRCETTVELAITNQSSRPLLLQIIEDLPPQLSPEPLELSATVRGRRDANVRYTVIAAQRGDAQLGPIYVRYRSPLQLAERWAVLPLEQTVRVYPNLQE